MPQINFAAPGPVAHAYYTSDRHVQVIKGPLGSSKTTTSVVKLLRAICSQHPDPDGVRKSRYLVTRSTYPELVTTTIADWKDSVPESLGSLTMGHPPMHVLDFDLPDGTRVKSTVYFVALDRPQHIAKVKGINLTGAWMNEAKQQPGAIFRELTSRVDRWPFPVGSNAWGGVIADTNAWDEDHWLENAYQQWLQGELPDYEFFIQPAGVIRQGGKWVENPGAELIPAMRGKYYPRVLQGKSEDWIKVNLANETGVSYDGRPVHPEYTDSVHTAKEFLQPKPGVINVGLDFGLTPAAVFFQRQNDGQWWALDEVVIDANGDAQQLGEAIKVKTADLGRRVKGGLASLNFVFRGDPSGSHRVDTDSETPYKVLRAMGILAFPCTTNDPEMRRMALRRPLTRLVPGTGQPGLIVSPNCKRFRKALAGGFQYSRVNVAGETDRFRDVPVKDMHSHVAEAGEYGLLDAGEHSVVNAAGTMNHQPPITHSMSSWNPLNV